MDIADVQSCQNYIVHRGVIREGFSVNEGDKVKMSVNPAVREGCARNHTATHIINYALEKTLGDVLQSGSSVKPNKLQFDFTCAKVLLSHCDDGRCFFRGLKESSRVAKFSPSPKLGAILLPPATKLGQGNIFRSVC